MDILLTVLICLESGQGPDSTHPLVLAWHMGSDYSFCIASELFDQHCQAVFFFTLSKIQKKTLASSETFSNAQVQIATGVFTHNTAEYCDQTVVGRQSVVDCRLTVVGSNKVYLCKCKGFEQIAWQGCVKSNYTTVTCCFTQ